MTNIAELGIAVDSGDAVQAATDLDKLTQAGAKAEKAAADLADGFDKASTAASGLSTSGKQVAESAEDAKARLLEMAKASLEASEYHQSLTTSLGTSNVAMDGAKKATTDWAAVQAEANARGQAILDTEARLAEETKKAAAATGVQADGLQALLGKINPTVAALQKLDDQQEQLNQHRKAGNIDAGTFKEYSADIEAARAKLKAFNTEAEDTNSGVSKLSLNTKATRENVLQLGNALAEGNFRVAVHNILEIATSAGTAALRLAAIVVPLGLAAAAVGGLAYAYHAGSEETDAYTKSLILSGNAAGLNADQLGSLAKQVSATVGTTGQAAAVLASLASGGKIAGDSFEAVTQAAVSMQEATGKAVGETVSEFVKLADDPVKASAALNEQYHYLTASVYSQIEALDKQGDHAGAVKLATEAYADAINERTPKIIDNLSLWEKGYNLVAKAADNLKNIGRANIDNDIDTARQNLEHAKAGDVGLFQNKDTMVEFYQDRLNMLEDQKAAEADIADYDAKQAKAQQDAVTAMGKVDALTNSALTNEEKRNKALKEYAQNLDKIRAANPNDARLNADTIAKNQANIRDQYKDPKAATSAVDLTGFNAAKNALAGIVSDYQNSQKQLDAAQKAGLISQASYSTQRSALIEAEKEQVSAAYQAEISALEAAKDKSTTTAAQRVELDQKIADARANMVKAQKEADSQLEVLATNETGRLAKEKRSIDSYVQALGEQQKALGLAGQRAVVGVGRGDKENALDSQLNSQQDRYAQQALELENQRSDPSRNMSDEEFARKSQALADANKKATDQIRKNYADVESAQGDWTKGATSAWENYLDSAKDIAGQTKSLFTNAFSSMEDAVVNFATTGKLSFSDFAKSVIADMARIAVRQAATGLLSSGISAFGSLFGGSSTASTAGSAASDYTGSAFSSYVAGARATGGGVSPNSLYQVNELGPELYSQGGKSYLMTGANGGSVTPLTSGASASMASSGGSSPVSVSISIASDGTTDVASNQAGLSSFGTEIGALVEQKYKQLEAKSLSPQGNIRKAINGRA